jgi:hypothetical protein
MLDPTTLPLPLARRGIAPSSVIVPMSWHGRGERGASRAQRSVRARDQARPHSCVDRDVRTCHVLKRTGKAFLREFFHGKGIFSDVSDRILLDCSWKKIRSETSLKIQSETFQGNSRAGF